TGMGMGKGHGPRGGGRLGSWRPRGLGEPTMAAHYGGQRAPDRRERDDAQMAGAEAVPAEAVAQLRRLAQHPVTQEVERVLADLDSAPVGPGAGIEAVRALRRSGAEYLRVADELEAAARCCRLAERGIGQRDDAPPGSWDGQ